MTSTKLKVGVFSFLSLVLAVAISVIVNDRPFWWRSCNLVVVSIPDASGLKTKTPVRTLGLQIGFLDSVELSETYVKLGICITAPVEVLPATRAYILSEGFLGDKAVELKPVRYLGEKRFPDPVNKEGLIPAPTPTHTKAFRDVLKKLDRFVGTFLVESAQAQTGQTQGREVPVGETSKDMQHLMNQVDTLAGELKSLTTNLKQTFNPDEMRRTMSQLNRTLENAARTLSPEGNLTSTAQRALAKLEDAIEQLKDALTRMNQGKGSVGMLLNDPTYAEELMEAIRNINRLLSKVGGVRFIVSIGAELHPAYGASRAGGKLGIWPATDRYYLLGAHVDPRGKTTSYTTVTTSGVTTSTVNFQQNDPSALLITAMLGKILWNRLDLSAGFMYGDGAISVGYFLGPQGNEDRLQLRVDGYARGAVAGSTSQINARIGAVAFPSMSPYLRTFYVNGGLDSIRTVNGQLGYYFGAGLSFEDRDIKVLFTFM